MKSKFLVLLIGLIGFGLPVTAATINVTTTDPAVAADGQCSLTEAIINANNDTMTQPDCVAGSGADVIVLATAATYVLDQVRTSFYGPNGLPRVMSEITIEGNGSTIERAAGAPQFRLLVVNASGILDLVDLTLNNGDSGDTYCGGALLNAFGEVQLTRTTVTGSTAPGGGGICNSSGPMTLTDCVVTLNTASVGNGGGLHNIAETADAALVLERTSVHDNTAGYIGGGVSSLSSDPPWVATLHVTESTVHANQAATGCGGLGNWQSPTEIDRSTFSDNTAETTEDWGGTGGGLCVMDSNTTISNSTISGNEAGGAATTMIFSGRGGGITVIGGAYGNDPTVDTVLTIEDSTICDNSAETLGGGISSYRYAGTMAVEIDLRNTIVAQNLEQGGALPGNCAEESPAVITSADFNLADDVTCGLMAVNDLVVADVMLSPLADNGGPTWTHGPQAGSPAVDSGDDLLCPEFDQIGNLRPWDGDDDGQAHCDRGAVELGAAFFVDGFESGNTSMWSATMP